MDTEWEGEPRKLVILANRNAFYYVPRPRDRAVPARHPVRHADLGRGNRRERTSDPDPGDGPSEEGTLVWPSLAGATNWYSPAYDPDRGTLFVPTREMASYYFKSDVEYEPGTPFLGGGERSLPEEAYGAVRALDAVSGELKWEFRQLGPAVSGILATATGVVFSGTMEGNVFALDADTGEALWDFHTGGQVRAAPMSFAIDGEQFVAVAAGQSVIVFGLPDASEAAGGS